MSPSSPAGDRSVSIIVPLYNEEENVPLLIKTIFNELGDDPAFIELVLVDDGSHDKTAAVILEYAQLESRVRLVQHDRNRGLGAAIRTGLQSARGDLILYTDADLPFDFSLMPKLISLADYDRVVSGYRLNRGEGPRRWILTKSYNLIISTLFGLRLHDVNFACKIIPKDLAQAVDLRSEGSFIDAEILLEAKRHGMMISEFPLVYFPRTLGQSTLSRPAVILVILREMANYALTTASAKETKVSLFSKSPLIRYGLAFPVTIIALLLTSLFQNPPIGFSWIFMIGVAAVSLYGGWKPGVLAAILSILAIDTFLLPPVWTLSVSWSDLPRGTGFVCAVLFATAVNAMRKTMTEEAKP